jgi:hypothetical protein
MSMAQSLRKLAPLAILAVAIVGPPAVADDRPRDLTLFLYTPSKIVFSYGETISSSLKLAVFFDGDGTAFVEPDKNVVIEVPAATRSGSVIAADNMRWTAEIGGSAAGLHLDLHGRQPFAEFPGLFLQHGSQLLGAPLAIGVRRREW